MNNTKCSCLYQALLTTREEYSREEARNQYYMLINAAAALSNPMKDNVIQTLNLAKDTLGNLSSERAYYNLGNINDNHHCGDCSETIETIRQLAKGQPLETNNTSKDTSTSECNSKTPDNDSDDEIEIQQVTDHRFRGKKLKLAITINPGNVTITEDEDRVTAKAKDKVIEYLAKLKREHPRRIRHIARMKPYLLKLLDGAPE